MPTEPFAPRKIGTSTTTITDKLCPFISDAVPFLAEMQMSDITYVLLFDDPEQLKEKMAEFFPEIEYRIKIIRDGDEFMREVFQHPDVHIALNVRKSETGTIRYTAVTPTCSGLYN